MVELHSLCQIAQCNACVIVCTSHHGRQQEFSQGGASPKKAPLKTKKAPPPPPKKKNCASTVLRGLGGMLSREKNNSGAPYYILDASQHERI